MQTGAARPGYKNLPVGLHHDGLCSVRAVRVEACRGLAAGSEVGVEGAVGVVAHDGEVFVAGAGDDHLAVGLQRQALRVVSGDARSDIGERHTVGVEACVKGAVGVIAHGAEVVAPLSGYDDLAIGLQRNIDPPVVGDSDDAVGVEGCVEASVGVVAHHSKICAGCADHNQFSVALHDDCIGAVLLERRAHVGGDDAVGVEGCVEASVDVVAHHPEVGVYLADGDDPCHRSAMRPRSRNARR